MHNLVNALALWYARGVPLARFQQLCVRAESQAHSNQIRQRASALLRSVERSHHPQHVSLRPFFRRAPHDMKARRNQALLNLKHLLVELHHAPVTLLCGQLSSCGHALFAQDAPSTALSSCTYSAPMISSNGLPVPMEVKRLCVSTTTVVTHALRNPAPSHTSSSSIKLRCASLLCVSLMRSGTFARPSVKSSRTIRSVPCSAARAATSSARMRPAASGVAPPMLCSSSNLLALVTLALGGKRSSAPSPRKLTSATRSR